MTVSKINKKQNQILGKLKERVKPYFASSNGAHDFSHIERVYNLSLHIGKMEDADLFIISLAAILHDIARSLQDRSNGLICHAKRGVKIAQEILSDLEVENEIIQRVCHCILTHRYRNNHLPETIEARVLFDADKLDSIGACGIGRAFLFAGGIGATLHIKDMEIKKSQVYTREDTAYREYKVKLKKIKDQMLTKEGKRLAVKRHEFMKKFFVQLDREVSGLL